MSIVSATYLSGGLNRVRSFNSKHGGRSGLRGVKGLEEALQSMEKEDADVIHMDKSNEELLNAEFPDYSAPVVVEEETNAARVGHADVGSLSSSSNTLKPPSQSHARSNSGGEFHSVFHNLFDPIKSVFSSSHSNLRAEDQLEEGAKEAKKKERKKEKRKMRRREIAETKAAEEEEEPPMLGDGGHVTEDGHRSHRVRKAFHRMTRSLKKNLSISSPRTKEKFRGQEGSGSIESEDSDMDISGTRKSQSLEYSNSKKLHKERVKSKKIMSMDSTYSRSDSEKESHRRTSSTIPNLNSDQAAALFNEQMTKKYLSKDPANFGGQTPKSPASVASRSPMGSRSVLSDYGEEDSDMGFGTDQYSDFEMLNDHDEELDAISLKYNTTGGKNRPCSWDYMLPAKVNKEFRKLHHTIIPERQKKILLMTIGSRGDVQPFIALGRQLQSEGYHVRLAAFDCFRKFTEDNNLEFVPLAGDPKELMKLCGDNEMFSVSFIVEALKNFRSFYKNLLKSAWKACRDESPAFPGKEYYPDLIVSNPPVAAHFHLAEALKIPCIIAFTMPWSRTGAFPHPMVADRGFDAKAYKKNYRSFKLLEKLTWMGTKDMINHWREKYLKLPSIHFYEGAHCLHVHRIPHIYCYSRHMLPKPDDWPVDNHVTNFWFLEESKNQPDFKPPEELVEFINAGSKPVYIGFGSIVIDDPDKLTRIIIEAVVESGCRAIISQGWGGMKATDYPKDKVYFIGACPHDWLFTQVAAVIHHGGAGTLAAGLRANRPTGVVAFFGDQFFWGPIIEQAKCGVFTSIKKVDKAWFVKALKTLTDGSLEDGAKYIGDNINSVDGVKESVDIIRKYLDADEPGFDRQAEVIWEVQRKYPVKGWSKRMLMPNDIYAVAKDENDQKMRRQIEDVVLHPGWEWEGEWFTGMNVNECDCEGFMYSSVGFKGPWHSEENPNGEDKFRRKRLFRLCARTNYLNAIEEHNVCEKPPVYRLEKVAKGKCEPFPVAILHNDVQNLMASSPLTAPANNTNQRQQEKIEDALGDSESTNHQPMDE
eukprot:Nk52_evm46s266 gene=Nk52_evmTU46s266